MYKIVKIFYTIILVSFFVTEVLSLPKPLGVKIQTSNLKECGILIGVKIKFSSFDVYYSESPDTITFVVQGKIFFIDYTNTLQFDFRLFKKFDNIFVNSCIANNGHFNSDYCEIENTSKFDTFTFKTQFEVEASDLKSNDTHVELSVKNGVKDMGCVTASLESIENSFSFENNSPDDKKKNKSQNPSEPKSSGNKNNKNEHYHPKVPYPPESPEVTKPPKGSNSSEGWKKGAGIGGFGVTVTVALVALRKKISAFFGCHTENTEGNHGQENITDTGNTGNNIENNRTIIVVQHV
ncbi:10608_t:CDS:2 [Funneliformis geosporum]|uniref:7235_t:CDS:1 n=1 Tax=Funneliformis geosporum TaxID=1117311 RepID=A0A9W4WSM3_9GLOM|nr:10608_t:CDS:2 [Funneliformis geosporum]CAI2169211.1 7235_t:CDS:2 [Funneliformis geosporum]